MGKYIEQSFGNYRLIRLLGKGGFAEVYLGEHLYLKSQAALKILHTQLSEDDIKAFVAEARTLVTMKHPHIVRVLEFGVQDGIPFLVMDYASNGTLRQRHPRGTRLPPATIVPYVKQMASALQYAHDQKLIHRDIKPENILLQGNDLLLSDFGIALVAQSIHLQKTIDIGGTAAYMAPEQFQGQAHIASDQYALGSVVYEWLSGQPPFKGSFSELYVQHTHATPPSLCAQVPTLPPAVEQVVMTALAKEPEQRYSTIQAFATALEQASHDPPTVIISNASTHDYSSPSYQSMESLQTQAQEPTIASQQSYPTSHPPVSGLDPYQVPQDRGRGRRFFVLGSVFSLFAVALIIFLAGGPSLYAMLFNLPNSSHVQATQQAVATTTAEANASATAASAVTATTQASATAMTPEGLYSIATSGVPVLDSSLTQQDANEWDVFSYEGGGGCNFSNNAYQVTMPHKEIVALCMAQNTSFSNFAFQVQMNILDGDGGGLIFRTTDDATYRFRVGPDGDYDLIGPEGGDVRGVSSAIERGTNTNNSLTVVAQDTSIHLYINRQHITTVNDDTSLSGKIGVFAVNFSRSAEVEFRNARVWQLS